jgi:hypothetical protein
MKKNTRLSFVIIALLAGSLTVTILGFQGCSEEEETCNGCNPQSPYSKPGNNQCFATKASCEQQLGPGCVVCY